MPPRLIIGLMSGTSVDAIDAALVRIQTRGKYHAQVLHHLEHPWPPKLRQRLLALMAPATTTTQELCSLNTLVAHEMAAAVEKILKATTTPKSQITALASHGQTICHLPPAKSKIRGGENRKSKIPSTLQLGDVSTLATLTGIPTVGNFRPADMAVAGQGAPLVPWTDDILLAHAQKIRCIQNIGGIANVTYLPKTTQPHRQVLAFDTGPGNMLLDATISLATHNKKRFDKNAHLARQGTLDMPLFRQLQNHPYFTQKPPKSTGREDFGMTFAKKLFHSIENAGGRKSKIENLLNTLTRLTAWSIADAYLHFLPQLPDEVILCGGGADNPLLTRMLAEEFARLNSGLPTSQKIAIRRIDDFGIPNKAKEAASFALLAAATLDHIPANLPSVTGAARPVILGVIARP